MPTNSVTESRIEIPGTRSLFLDPTGSPNHGQSRQAVIDAGWLRELCLAAGADDAAAVSLDHADLASEREHVLAAFPPRGS